MIIKRKGTEIEIGEAAMDMTPMTDCIFLLLIFFMITTTFIDVRGLVVDLPGPADQQEEQQQKKKDINVTISSEGQYTVAGSPVPAEALASAIKGAMEENNNKNVIFQGDPQAPHGAVIYAMDVAKGQGVEGMAFAVEQQARGAGN
ncbi:MAG: biopolymer transporter ExbD [Candidatus Latescibacter sp.]|nr:biopolymer transporter ExbD [Candidatus Latescibacter sp.]